MLENMDLFGCHHSDKYDTIINKMIEEVTTVSDKYETVQYGKKKISKAGRILADPHTNDDDFFAALEILNNWRAAHALPLDVVADRLAAMLPEALVARRLKRLDSIVMKLKRFQDMDLYRIQDLGGCRAIVRSVDDVYNAVDKVKSQITTHELKREYDYLANPKSSGYRSYHLVFQYNNEEDYKNMLIEMQIRTELQHIWATAIEVMGLYTKSSLKSSQGDEKILRFFALASSIFAIEEGLPVVPGTPDTYDKLVAEMKGLDNDLNMISKISSLSMAINNAEVKHKGDDTGYYLLLLNYEERRLRIYSFPKDGYLAAIKSYNKLEKETGLDVVLVSAGSLDQVRMAYPNYFVDMQKFLEKVRLILEE